MQVVYFF